MTAAAVRVLSSPERPGFAPGPVFWRQTVAVLWWLLVGRTAVGALRLFLVLKDRPHENRILSCLLTTEIYVAMALAIVKLVFALPLGGRLAASRIMPCDRRDLSE